MIVEEQNLKDIKIEYESEDCTTGRVVDLPMDSLHSFTIDYASCWYSVYKQQCFVWVFTRHCDVITYSK